jgi:2-oxoglutarate dehydrogenase complex dehydrogenase (E1) component-like enzyme
MFTLPSQHFSASKAKIPKNNNLIGMIEWYRRNGHKMAKTDPLQLQSM